METNTLGVYASTHRSYLLDGIRGYASVAVLLYHTLPWLSDWVSPGTGKYLSRFVAFDGMLAVYVFFVISGCSLSLGFMHSGNVMGIAHLAIRRLPRLCIPIFVSCLAAYILLSLNLMRNTEAGALAGSPEWLGSFFNFPPSFTDMLGFSLGGVFFAYDPTHSYNPVLWTMPPELAGSVLVFALLALRYLFGCITATYILVAVLLATLRSSLLAFLLGMLLAEVLVRGADATDTHPRLFMAGFVAIVCARLAGITSNYDPLTLSLVACVMVFIIIRSRALRSLFLGPTAHLAGRISFPLYLVHIPLLSSASSTVFLALAGSGIPAYCVAALVAAIQIACSIAGALAFLPVEEFAKHVSRRLSTIILKFG